MESSERLHWVDFAKGIGIILVVYGHVLKGVYGAGLPINLIFFQRCNDFLYSFHMPLFFILSGLFFEHSLFKSSTSGFVISKAKSLLYPFAIWSLIQTAFELISSKYTNNRIGIDQLFLCVFLPRAQFWFVYIMFFVNLIDLGFYKSFNKKYLPVTLAVSLLYLVIAPSLPNLLLRLLNLAYFNLGIVFSRNFIALNRAVRSKIFLLFLVITFIGSEYVYFHSNHMAIWNLIFPAVLGSLLVMTLGFYLSSVRPFGFLEYLGKNSLIIYLSHLLFGNGFRIILQKLFAIQNVTVHLLLGTAAGILLPIAFLNTFGKIKIFNWLFQFPDRGRKQKMKTQGIS